jgi:glycosyltransferase involved in cell wall biosynthesis
MKISAIITTFNRRELLQEALASVRAQSRPPDEIIIIDDGSTDGTDASCSREGLLYHWQENAGTSAARNRGWQLASGDWIAYLDSDDFWESEKLARQEAAVLADPTLEAIFGHAINFSDEADTNLFDTQKHRLGVPTPAWLPGAALVPRSLLEHMGGFDTSFKTAEVVDWIMRLRERSTKMLMLPDIVMRRRLHRGNKQLESEIGRRENFALLRRWQGRRLAGETSGQ